MRAIVVTEPGGPQVLALTEVPDPVPAAGEVLIRVAATAVNRADVMQRKGFYPPPAGASELLGLECSGTIVALGAGVTGWQVGDRACALLAGGGYAELVAVPAVQLLPIPAGVDLIEAAGLPEVVCTVWSNLVMTARLTAGELLLVHGGSSGIGTMAIQIGKAIGARVAVTASRESSLQACRELGADIAINYAEGDWVEQLRLAAGAGADVILDVVGAKYLQRNVSALADGGRLVVIGLLGGARAELDLNELMRRRGSVIGTTLRSRPVSGPGSKAEVVAQVREHVWPLVEAGVVRPVIQAGYPLAEAARAHAELEAGGHLGKILLTVPTQP